MINYFNHASPVMTNHGEVPAGCRLLTIGAPLLENEQPPLNLFFPLEDIREIQFYYGIPEEEVKDDAALLDRIKSHVKHLKASLPSFKFIGFKINS